MNGSNDGKSTLDAYIKRATATILSAVDDLALEVEKKNRLRRVIMDAHELLYHRLKAENSDVDG